MIYKAIYKKKLKKSLSLIVFLHIVQKFIKGATGTNFNPNNIVGGFEKYENAYSFITNKCKA